MDTTPDRKREKRRSELGSAKQSHGNIDLKIDETEELPPTPDYDELDEINYDDPAVQKWLDNEQAESIQRYGKLTSEEVEYMSVRRIELQRAHPEKSILELNLSALQECRSRRTKILGAVS